MRHSLISLWIFTLITFSWCLIVELLTLPFHIHHSHWYRWLLSWAVISSLSSKPSENMGRTAVSCQIALQDTLLPSKKSQRRHGYRNAPSTAVLVWVSPATVLVWVSPATAYFWTWLYWTWDDLWALGGSFHLAGPCKKIITLRLLILTALSPTFGSHVSTLAMSSTPVMLPNQRQLTWTENDPWMEPSSLQALFPLSTAPLLPFPVWSVSEFPSLAHSVFWGSDFSFPIVLPPLLPPSSFLPLFYPLLYDYFDLDYATSFFTCTYLCVFSMHVILLKYVLKLARNCHQHFTQNMARS